MYLNRSNKQKLMKKTILFLKARIGIRDPLPPLAFSYLGSIAEKRGFKVIVENLNAQYNNKTNQEIIGIIKREEPIIVGISIITNNARDSYKLIKEIKPFCKTIIAGGPHATICPEEVIEKGADIAVIGEAEVSFEKLINAILLNKNLSSLKGIAYKKNGKVIITKSTRPFNLNNIPIPNKEIHRKSDYIRIPEEINNFGAVLTSRGCSGRCTFCFHSLFGNCFRFKSAENILKEIIYLNEKYNIKFIDFVDDAFTVNKKRLNEICDLLIEKKLSLEWVCASRIDFLDRETIFKMKKAGCIMISLGIETNIPETLKRTQKTANPGWYVQQSYNVLKWCYEAKIRAGVNILMGFPWETLKDMENMRNYIEKIKLYVTQGFDGGIIQPQPGTEIYKQYSKEYGFEKWWLYKKPLFKDDYRPFFMAYYHKFWDHLHNNFFKFDEKRFNKLNKLYKIMGKWNLYIITKRRFSNPLLIFMIYNGLFILSNISLALFNISPKLERVLFEKLQEFSYRFKFKK